MFLTNFLKSQLFITPPVPIHDFSGKTIIVTGSNTGLGLEAARYFARLNCSKLILAVRDTTKGHAAKESIAESIGPKPGSIEVWELDLSSNASVEAFAKRARGLERLDAVVENAGMMTTKFTIIEGFEQTIKVNVIGTLLLALLLLPKLRETGQQHRSDVYLEIVTSEVHHITTVDEADQEDLYAMLNIEKNHDAQKRYSISKALELLFIRELVDDTGDTPIITLVNPGLCRSEFTREITKPVEAAIAKGLHTMLARTTEVGSRTLVAGVCAGRESHGCYMSDGVNQECAAWVKSKRGVEVQRKVYEQTMRVLEGICPGVGANI